jgi:bifunctional non-homologous end joining protein LigD
VRTFIVRSHEEDDREVTSFLVDDADTLLYLANLGSIPIHVLASRAEQPERCDFATIDFDLGPSPLVHAIDLARSLRALCDEVGLPSFPKTSGQTGLHVLVPLGGVPFVAARALTEVLARIVASRHPELCTLERRREKRPQAVYIDTGQVGATRSIVAPYSVRAYRGGRVSTPLHWDEVGLSLDPSTFTIFSVPERVARIGDPMAGMLETQPDLASALEGLARHVPKRRGA